VIGYTWSWAENQVLAAMKAMSLGQSAGQRVLLDLGRQIAQLAGEFAAAADAPADAPSDTAAAGAADSYSNFAPGLAILSSQHESQYSRLFRS